MGTYRPRQCRRLHRCHLDQYHQQRAPVPVLVGPGTLGSEETAMTFTVDVHHHILPDFFWAATNEGSDPVGGIQPPPWSEDSALSFLDDAGIDVAITSISTPGVHTGDDAAARVLARRCNELTAELMRKHPRRFGGFACLPLPDIDGSLDELRHALDVLHLDGVVLFSNARGVYLGDKRLTELFDEVKSRKAVVFVHPNASPTPWAHSLGLPDSLIDFTADTTRAIAQMHYSNTFARTPDVTYIFSHARSEERRVGKECRSR